MHSYAQIHPRSRRERSVAPSRPRLLVSAPGHASEREAQRISERPSHASQPGVQARQAGPSAAGSAIAPPIVHKALASPGRPLDQAVRAAIAPRFGHDFARVRIHTDEIAARSARALNALAYTVGRDLVFARGQYAPGTAHGRRLLAHELAHVVQQDGSPGAGIVQRAEVDDRSCAGLMDIEPDIDTHVNKEIVDERTSMDKPIFAPLLVLHVMQRLGGRSPISPIETFIEALPASKRTLPPSSLAGTKFSGVENVNKFYRLQALGAAHVVGSVVKIRGICVGADKLGHFFDQGFDYLEQASKPGSTASDIDNLGRVMEAGVFGLAMTGVFSNADIAANRAGLQFYKDLKRNPPTPHRCRTGWRRCLR
jgi:hypothetical protein